MTRTAYALGVRHATKGRPWMCHNGGKPVKNGHDVRMYTLGYLHGLRVKSADTKAALASLTPEALAAINRAIRG